MNLFHQHKQSKAQSVSLYDRISAGLGIMGGLLIATSLMQPKANANPGRLLAAVAFFGASVAVERIRSDDVQSLDRADEVEKEIKSERIRRQIKAGEFLKAIDEAEELYSLIPIDRHEEFADVIGVKPPNIEARQAMQPVTQQATATMNDPTGDFDPETEPVKQQWGFVHAEFVESWFQEMGDRIPQGLVDEWRSRPGSAIAVEGSNVKIIRGES